MNTQDTVDFVTSPAGITKLAETIMASDQGANLGRATYLRSLLAATQTEIAGKPVIRVTGRAKRPTVDDALAAFERANKPFYDAVLAAVPQGLTAEQRQSKTSFARSASATLRRAISTGWNPLGHGVGRITKAELAVWTAAHTQPRAVTPKAAEKAVMGLTERIAQTLENLDKPEAARILQLALAELGVKSDGADVQRITAMRIRKHEAPRTAAH